MSKFSVILICMFMTFSLMSQVPFSFNYQGLARDADGTALNQKEISLLISLISGFENGNIEFQEEHVVTTDENGLFSVKIGEGDFLLGNLRNIDWGEDVFFIRTEMDPKGGEDYVLMGTSKLHSVPYALFAAEAANSGNSGDNDGDPTNEIQILGINGNQLSISRGNSVLLPSQESLPDQLLALNGKTLSISRGNAIDLSSISNDADADPTNELQALNISGNALSISGGNTVQLPTGGSGTDNQTLSLSGKTLSIIRGNSVNLSSISNDADADPTNEIQALNISGNTLSISGANSVQLPSGGSGTDNQTLSLSGKTLSISGGNSINLSSVSNDADSDPTNELQLLQLNGNTLSLSSGNAVNLPGGSSPWEVQGNGLGYSGDFVSLQNNDKTSALELVRFDAGSGGLDIYDGTDRKVEIFSNVENAGLARFNGGNGNVNILLSNISGNANRAWIGTYNENADNIGAMFVSASGRGGLLLNGPNGNRNIDLTALGSNVNHGFITVNDVAGNSQAGMYVDNAGNGRIFADFVDSFVDNPEKSNQQIRYSTIQGPETAAYLRGTGQLKTGQGQIHFPKHFQKLIDNEGITVMITPLSANSKGIAVIEKNSEGFAVQELLNGKGTYEFDWEVKGVRVLQDTQKSALDSSFPLIDHFDQKPNLSRPKEK